MSAKTPPIAYRPQSSPTLVGTVDYWRMRREYIEDTAVRLRDPSDWMPDMWMHRLHAARMWEALKTAKW